MRTFEVTAISVNTLFKQVVRAESKNKALKLAKPELDQRALQVGNRIFRTYVREL